MHLHHHTKGVHEPALVMDQLGIPMLCNRSVQKLCCGSLISCSSPYRYHCHTCKMVDGVGVCTVCAKVCHKDHEISYAKYGSFFCDCGAKEDGSCQVRPNTSGHHGKRATAVTLACKSFIIDCH